MEQTEGKKTQVVKSRTKAYNYSYASLADIAKQGFKIPKMSTRVIKGQTFVCWYDEKLEDWIPGAPLIVPEMRGMNAAQAMGSALTYARRYTAQMALGLACDDDAKLEKTEGAPMPTGRTYETPRIDFRQIREKLQEIADVDALRKYWTDLHLSDKQANILKADFGRRKNELEGEEDVVE